MDKNFKVTVNGKEYDIKVQEVEGNSFKATDSILAKAMPVQEPQKVQEPVKTNEVVTGTINVNAPMPGAVWKILKKAGDKVAKNEAILILEVMKMENEIVAPEAGEVASIEVRETEKVNVGQTLVKMKI